MSRDISMLHPTLQTKIAQLKNKCKAQGLIIGISECYRTVKEQDYLYSKGRTIGIKGKTVTNAKGSSYQSFHQWRTAVDFYRNDGKGAYNNSDGFFEKVGKIGQSIGLQWGAEWGDNPHFQLPDWGSTPDKLKRLYGTPDKFKASWKIEVKPVIKKVEEEEMVEKRYNTYKEVPEWGKSAVRTLINKDAFADVNKLDLTYDMIRMFVLMKNADLLK